ncbi:hypothetical protein ACWFMX_21590, partial [Bacillus subtilis]
SANVSLVGTAQQPGRQAPLTGNQARKDLVESDSPERETRKPKGRSGNRKGTEENRTRKSLIESETQDSKTK